MRALHACVEPLPPSWTPAVMDSRCARVSPFAPLLIPWSGGVVKGWTVDHILGKLVGLGFTDCLFEWGGDMRAAGSHPLRNDPWKVCESRPRAAN